MTTAQVVETSVTVNNKNPIQDYVHPNRIKLNLLFREFPYVAALTIFVRVRLRVVYATEIAGVA